VRVRVSDRVRFKDSVNNIFPKTFRPVKSHALGMRLTHLTRPISVSHSHAYG